MKNVAHNNMSTTILLLGKNGYVGAALYEELSKNFDYLITGVDKEMLEQLKPQHWDMVINCAMPSKRLWAQNNPYLDYVETVNKTANFYYNLCYGKFVQISSISARSQVDTVYGRNKLAAESLINHDKNLIFRLTAMYSDGLSKGVVFDLINNNPVYVSNKSSYSFASLDYCCKYICDNLTKTAIIEVGGAYAISLEEVCDRLEICRKFSSDYIDKQEVKNEDLMAPSPYLVCDYIEQKVNNKTNKEEMKKFYNEAERK